MLDSLITFLWSNLTPYGTFKAYWNVEDTLEDNNVFMNFLFLDAVKPHLERYPRLKSLADSVLKATVKYRPQGDLWKYWVDRRISPDFDDISLAGIVLPSYGIKFDTSVVMDTIRKYTDTSRMCVVIFSDEESMRKRWCDCVVNVNVLRFTRDTSLCGFIRQCVRSPSSYTYLQPRGFLLYFLSKAYREGITCGIDVKREVVRFISEDLEGMDLVLGFAAATNVGLKGKRVKRMIERIHSRILSDGGLPENSYFRAPWDRKKYIFFGRTLPTILFLDGILKYYENRP